MRFLLSILTQYGEGASSAKVCSTTSGSERLCHTDILCCIGLHKGGESQSHHSQELQGT